LITKDGKYSAKDVYYLDLSKLNIRETLFYFFILKYMNYNSKLNIYFKVSFENLEQCQNLKHLIVGHNDLDCLLGLEKLSLYIQSSYSFNRLFAKRLDDRRFASDK